MAIAQLAHRTFMTDRTTIPMINLVVKGCVFHTESAPSMFADGTNRLDVPRLMQDEYQNGL